MSGMYWSMQARMSVLDNPMYDRYVFNVFDAIIWSCMLMHPCCYTARSQIGGMAALSLWCKFGEYVNYMCQYSMVGPAQKADFGRAHERAIDVCLCPCLSRCGYQVRISLTCNATHSRRAAWTHLGKRLWHGCVLRGSVASMHARYAMSSS